MIIKHMMKKVLTSTGRYIRTYTYQLLAVLIIGLGVAGGFFIYSSEINKTKAFQLGLDLSGGAKLVYVADTTGLSKANLEESLNSLRDLLERRVNTFGVSEPLVSRETVSTLTSRENRINIELPGVTDLKKAESMIGQTPVLEFKTENPNYDPNIIKKGFTITPDMIKNGKIDLSGAMSGNDQFTSTELTGRFLSRSTLQFDSQTGQPVVALQFNDEGSKLFEKITGDNIGKRIAIYLDGGIVSAPTVNQAITGGQAIISGDFTPDEAKVLVGRLNSGALPVPITLIATDSVIATLGLTAVHAGMYAGIIALIFIGGLLLVWYRLPGFISIISLCLYATVVLILFKVIPVTLTAAGIAGFIISLGMAVDANILIFERMREERALGKSVADTITIGFDRAWTSIRDGNLTSIITAVVLYSFGTTLMQAFAVAFGLGVIISLVITWFTTRVLLRALLPNNPGKIMKFLSASGIATK